jgi:hypothetical protein
MSADFVIARNAEPGSTLPYLLRVPLGDPASWLTESLSARPGSRPCRSSSARPGNWPTSGRTGSWRPPEWDCPRRWSATSQVRGLEAGPPLAPARPTPADVRRWAPVHDIVVSDRGRIPAAGMDQYLEARGRGET